MSEKEQKLRSVKSVPVWLLITIALAFGVGLVSGLVIMKLTTASGSTLSTTAIISFTFTVALGAASIILASLTIVLSRSAEDALTKRSDEGIRLQTDVFVRTNEVLSKIQTSTGVTEKRLEDIISGRTSVIAKEVVERSFRKGETAFSSEAEDRLKKSLAESLKEELVPLLSRPPMETERRLLKMEARQKKEADITQRWRNFRESIVAELAKLEKTKIISETQGDTTTDTMEEFWDVILDIEGQRVALDIRTAEQIGPDRTETWFMSGAGRNQFARNVVWRALQDKISIFFWVWNEDVSNEPAIIELSKLLHESLRDTNFVFLHGGPEEIAHAVLSHKGAAQPRPAEGDEEAQAEDPGDKK